MNIQHSRRLLKTCVILALVFSGESAHADLVLNATGIADGFTASNFATGLTSNSGSFGFGPFGLAVTSNGSGGTNVLVNDAANSTLYTFNNSDGQTPASALYINFSNSSTAGYATLNGVAYGSNNGQFGSFSSTGVFTPFSIAGLPGPYLGMAGNNTTGEIIATSSSGLIAINPTAQTFRVINAGVIGDGVSISPDGKTAYVENNGNIYGYDLSTGALKYTAPKPAGSYSPDGTGVIQSSNGLNGDIIVNDNNGNVYLINVGSNTIGLIGTDAGQRGDYTAPDFSTGTLLMDFSTQVERLSCGAGCGIGAAPIPPNGVPAPGSLALFGAGIIGYGMLRRRRNHV